MPYPVAAFAVFVSISVEHGNAAVIGFVPADGIEEEGLVVFPDIFHGCAGDDIVWNFFEILRNEVGKGGGIFSVGEAIAFKGADCKCLVNPSLVAGGGFRGLAEIWNANRGNKVIRRDSSERV